MSIIEWRLKKFEALTTHELYAVLKARSEVFVVEQSIQYLDLDDKDKNAYHLFLQHKNLVIAYLRILNRGEKYQEVSIGRVLVIKEYRKLGYASQMLEKAIKFIQEELQEELQEESIRLLAQNESIPLYQKHKFKVVGESYIEEGIPHSPMMYCK